MEINLYSFFRKNITFAINRILRFVFAILCILKFGSDELFRLWFVAEAAIPFIAIILGNIRIPVIAIPSVTILLSVFMYIFQSIVMGDLLLAAFLCVEVICFTLSFGIKRKINNNIELYITIALIICLVIFRDFLILLGIFVFLSVIKLNFYILRTSGWRTKVFVNQSLNYSTFRHSLGVVVREFIVNGQSVEFGMIILRVFNQMNLFVWSYIRSSEGLKINFPPGWILRVRYYCAGFAIASLSLLIVAGSPSWFVIILFALFSIFSLAIEIKLSQRA